MQSSLSKSDYNQENTSNELLNRKLHPKIEIEKLMELAVPNKDQQDRIYFNNLKLEVVYLDNLNLIVSENKMVNRQFDYIEILSAIYLRLEVNLLQLKTDFSNINDIISKTHSKKLNDFIPGKINQSNLLKKIFSVSYDFRGILYEIINDHGDILKKFEAFKLCTNLARLTANYNNEIRDTSNYNTFLFSIHDDIDKIIRQSFKVLRPEEHKYIFGESSVNLKKKNIFEFNGNILFNPAYNDSINRLKLAIETKSLKGSKETFEKCKELTYCIFKNEWFWRFNLNTLHATIFYFASKNSNQQNSLQNILNEFESNQDNFNELKENRIQRLLEEKNRFMNVFS